MSFVEVLIALLLLIVLALAVLADIVVLDGLLAQINKLLVGRQIYLSLRLYQPDFKSRFRGGRHRVRWLPLLPIIV